MQSQPFNQQKPKNFLQEINPQCKKIIMERILDCQRTEMVKKRAKDGERNLLNKWFQDSVKNYIMEAHAAPLLKKRLQSLNSINKVKNYVHNMISKKHKKYIGILNAYYEVLGEVNCREDFCSRLVNIVNNASYYSENQDSFNKIIRKQFVCILLLYFFDNKSQNQSSSLNEINSFFDLWNLCFPQERQTSKKKSQEQKKNESTAVIKDSLGSSISIPKNSPGDLSIQPIETLNPVKVYIYEELELQTDDNEVDDNQNLYIFSEQPPLPDNSQITCHTWLFKNNDRDISFPDNYVAQTPTYEDCCLDPTFISESNNLLQADNKYQQPNIYEYTNISNYQDNPSPSMNYFSDSDYYQNNKVFRTKPHTGQQSNYMVFSQRFFGQNNQQSMDLTLF